MTVPIELTQAYFYPLGFFEEGSEIPSVTLTMLEETYSAVLVGGSGGESGGESGGTAAVPEPGTMGAMLLAIGAMAGMGFRRRKA
jgi:hypothetical protein